MSLLNYTRHAYDAFEYGGISKNQFSCFWDPIHKDAQIIYSSKTLEFIKLKNYLFIFANY